MLKNCYIYKHLSTIANSKNKDWFLRKIIWLNPLMYVIQFDAWKVDKPRGTDVGKEDW
jgi:hypothetical protein